MAQPAQMLHVRAPPLTRTHDQILQIHADLPRAGAQSRAVNAANTKQNKIQSRASRAGRAQLRSSSSSNTSNFVRFTCARLMLCAAACQRAALHSFVEKAFRLPPRCRARPMRQMRVHASATQACTFARRARCCGAIVYATLFEALCANADGAARPGSVAAPSGSKCGVARASAAAAARVTTGLRRNPQCVPAAAVLAAGAALQRVACARVVTSQAPGTPRTQ